jgi:hypothetical protein
LCADQILVVRRKNAKTLIHARKSDASFPAGIASIHLAFSRNELHWQQNGFKKRMSLTDGERQQV